MNREEARDAIYTHAGDSWLEACQGADVENAEIRFKGVPKAEPAQGTTWARVSTQVVDEYQETLRNNTRRFVTVGIIFFQIFVPRNSPTALVVSDRLSEIVRNTYRDREVAEHLEFTAAAIDDNVGTEPAWLAVTVTARFWYRQFI